MRFCLQESAAKWEVGLQKGVRVRPVSSLQWAEWKGFLEETPPSASLKPRQEAGTELKNGDR